MCNDADQYTAAACTYIACNDTPRYTSMKNNWIKLMDEVGMACSTKKYTNKGNRPRDNKVNVTSLLLFK